MHESEVNNIKIITEAGNKKTWRCPVFIELDSGKTLADDFYQDDGTSNGPDLS